MSKSSSSSSSHDSEDEEYKKRSQQRQSWDNVARGCRNARRPLKKTHRKSMKGW